MSIPWCSSLLQEKSVLGQVRQIVAEWKGSLLVMIANTLVLTHRTKKFLKKQQLRDWLRVVSTSQGVYELRFFNVVNDDAEEDDE